MPVLDEPKCGFMKPVAAYDCALAELVTGHSFRSVRTTSDVKPQRGPRPRCGQSGVLLAATNDLTAGATCKQHDAAPVLFGPAASAADQVRRLDSLNAKLGRGLRELTVRDRYRASAMTYERGLPFGLVHK